MTMLAGERLLTACPTPPFSIKLHTSPSPDTLYISHSQPFPSLQHSFHGIPSLQKHSLWNLRACADFRVSSGPRVSADFKVSSSTSGSDEPRDSGFPRKKLAVFVSGGGSNFQTLHQASLKNKIYGDVAVVVSDKPACKACDYAKSNNISVVEYPKSTIARSGLSPTELVATLRQYEIDFVLLAGFLKLLPGELIQAYPRAILNIHPALLPAFGGKGFYGRKVHEAVIKSGARYSGPTIHFVDEKYDHGVILAQRVVPVLPYDTADDLAARVLKEEHSLYPEVVAAICEDRIFWREDSVPLIRRSWDEADYY